MEYWLLFDYLELLVLNLKESRISGSIVFGVGWWRGISGVLEVVLYGLDFAGCVWLVGISDFWMFGRA